MALKVPKIVYGPSDTELLFTYPPVQKPGADEMVADRHDSITASGLKQSINQRVDIFRTLQMDFVPFDDLGEWESFMDWALLGNAFSYYPDSTSEYDYEDWTLEDTSFNPKFQFRGFAKFTLKMRKLVTFS